MAFSCKVTVKPVLTSCSLCTDTTFPSDLPVPKDDGAYDHLTDFAIPSDVSLPVANNPLQKVRPAELEGLTVLFCYPRTGISTV
jgi:hypothetical protein